MEGQTVVEVKVEDVDGNRCCCSHAQSAIEDKSSSLDVVTQSSRNMYPRSSQASHKKPVLEEASRSLQIVPKEAFCLNASSEHDLVAMVHDFMENGSFESVFPISSDGESGLLSCSRLLETLQVHKFLSLKFSTTFLEKELFSILSIFFPSVKDVDFFCLTTGKECKGYCIQQMLVKHLRVLGYDAAICSSKWKNFGKVPGGEYEYIDVFFKGERKTTERLIVDVDFQSQFEIARPTHSYAAALKCLPIIFSGSEKKLRQVLQVMAEAAKMSLKQNSMPFPPWRTLEYMLAKWLSPSGRTTDDIQAGTKLLQPVYAFTRPSLQQRHRHLRLHARCYCMAASTTSEVSLANVLWNKHRSQAMIALYHPFIVSLSAGVLDISSFRNYIAQDAFFLQAFSTAYHLLRDNVDDDSSKLTVNHLLQGARDELQLHSSYAQAWGVDLSHDLSHPNKATVKYTEFLLATASSEERKKGERTLLDRQRVAAFTVAAMTPCMRLYAFLGQEIRNFLGGDSPESPYREWINTYSSKEFQSSTLQIEGLLDTLAADLGEDDVSKLEKFYSQAFTLELEFFSAQPNCQCTLLPFIRRQIDGSDASYLLMVDFDLTCSVSDSCSALANVSVQAALKNNQGLRHQKSAAEIRSRWDILEKSYSEHHSRICIPPEVEENCDRFFNVDGLRSFLERLSSFEIKSNTEIIRQGIFEGLNLEDVWNAGCDMALQEGCTNFLRQVSSNQNVNFHIISVCWSESFVKGALAKEGLENVEVHSNEFITSGSCTSGDIKRVIETPFDKERVFEELMHNLKSLSRSVRSIYIGDSVTDLLCLLEADMGIVIGSDSTLQRVSKAFGVLMMPLYKGVLEMAKLGNARGGKKPGVIYTVRDWHEISAFLIASSES
ncbi:hypothetical protein L7F22_045006 [Adiantum nelumboides]|nr:hypothetical protein [Adiantum nelumboides]